VVAAVVVVVVAEAPAPVPDHLRNANASRPEEKAQRVERNSIYGEMKMLILMKMIQQEL